VSDPKKNKIKEIIKTMIKPPQVYSWQTFILLTIISLIFATISFSINFINGIKDVNFIQNLIANCGFIFLIIGISWISIEQEWLIRYWLISSLICLFIFGNISQLPISLGFIFFPIIASLIAIFPYFIDKKFNFHGVEEKHRLKVILILGIHLMLTCWLQVYFLFNHWTNQYPSLLADNLSQSSFIINLNPVTYPRGIYWLEQIQFSLNSQLNNKQWFLVERWINNALETDTISQLKKQIIQNTPPILEDSLWNLKIKITQKESGYNLKILAFWQGPKATEKDYFCQKLCTLQPLLFSVDEPELTTSQLKCQPTHIQGWKK